MQINIAAIKNIKGLKYGINSNIWNYLHRKGSIIVIKNVNDVLCLPRAIAVGITYAEYQNDQLNKDLKKRFKTVSKNDCGDGCRCTFGLQKCTALEYQKKVGIPYYTPGILDHVPLYEKSLQLFLHNLETKECTRVILVINYKSLYITFLMKTLLIWSYNSYKCIN